MGRKEKENKNREQTKIKKLNGKLTPNKPIILNVHDLNTPIERQILANIAGGTIK